MKAAFYAFCAVAGLFVAGILAICGWVALYKEERDAKNQRR